MKLIELRLTLDCEGEVDRGFPFGLIVGDALQLVSGDVGDDTHAIEGSVGEEIEEVRQSGRVGVLLREVHCDVISHVVLRIPEQIKLVVVEPEFVIDDRVQVRQGRKCNEGPIWNHLLSVVNPKRSGDIVVEFHSYLMETRLMVIIWSSS